MSDGPADYEPNDGLNTDLGAAASGYELRDSHGKPMFTAKRDNWEPPSSK